MALVPGRFIHMNGRPLSVFFARCEMETVRAVLREYGYPEVIEKTKF